MLKFDGQLVLYVMLPSYPFVFIVYFSHKLCAALLQIYKLLCKMFYFC